MGHVLLMCWEIGAVARSLHDYQLQQSLHASNEGWGSAMSVAHLQPVLVLIVVVEWSKKTPMRLLERLLTHYYCDIILCDA